MHSEIRRIAGDAGFREDDGTLLIVPYGAEDIALLISALGGPHTVNTIITFLSLCGVPEPQATMRALTDEILAPGGAVAKITGKEGLGFTGKARTFDSEDEMVAAVESGSIKKGEKTVVVLRYLGPKGGPGESVRPDDIAEVD